MRYIIIGLLLCALLPRSGHAVVPKTTQDLPQTYPIPGAPTPKDQPPRDLLFTTDYNDNNPPPSRRKVPRGLIAHDSDESLLIGVCPVCGSDKFTHYEELRNGAGVGGLTVYRCTPAKGDKSHAWSYSPGYTEAIIYED